MKTLKNHIAPGEPILWRTRTYRQVLKGQLWPPGGLMAFGLLLQLFSDDPEFFGFLFWLPLAWMLFVAAYPLGDWSEVFLTERRLIFIRRFRRPRVQTTERRDIRELEIFEGGGQMVVHGRHGERQHAFMFDDMLSLARKLNLPTRIWKPQEPPKPAGRRRVAEILPWFVIPAAILTVLFGGLAGALETVDVYLGPDHIRSTYSEDTVGFIGMMFSFALLLLGFVAGGIAMGGIRRLVMTPSDLALLRCRKCDPLWRGEMPVAPPQSGVWRMTHALQRGYHRLAYGPPAECAPPEPERIEPGAFPPPEADEES